MMSTGDLKGCLRKLDAQLRALKYPREVDYNGLSKGDPAAFLPIVSYAFVSFSPHLAEHLVGFGVELTGKSDLRFLEAVYKVLRDLFHYKPALSKQQFLQFGFAERKTCVLCDVIAFALQKHKELGKLGKPKPRARFQAWSSESKSEVVPFQGYTIKPTASALSLSRPLVERHLGRGVLVSSSMPSEDEESQEEEEDDLEKCPGVEESLEQVSTLPQTDPAVEGRLVALEAQMQEVQARLGRLLTLVQRMDLLERSSAGPVTVDKRQWENLESRVLLLETRLALSTASGQVRSSVRGPGTRQRRVLYGRVRHGAGREGSVGAPSMDSGDTLNAVPLARVTLEELTMSVPECLSSSSSIWKWQLISLASFLHQRESLVVSEGGSHYMVENATEITEPRHSCPESLPHTRGSEHVQSSIPGASYPISPSVETERPEDNMKERLERISNMMKDTSSLLQSIDASK
uniref:Centrosomal protein of 44 kDa n=1 Tax=Esox lucius TaxID=8010 RepID=A0AAY5KMJ1_ESOLU